MKRPDDLDPFDPALRRILDADPGVAERIARRALETDAPVRRWQPAAVTAFASAALIVALLLIGPHPENNPAPPTPPGSADFSITNVGDVIAVTDRAGNASIVHVGDAVNESEAAPGGQIFISMGENQ